MGFSCGIVGLPNIGKSTLFNALTRTGQAQAANYPFCTIEPNSGEVDVPDPRLAALAAIAGSERIVPARMSFVDIAGLVKGASAGEGLGNRFLAHIRNVEAIAHVLRCFEDSAITHVSGQSDPIADLETVQTELMLADLESLQRRMPALEKKATRRDKEAILSLELCALALEELQAGRPAILADIAEDQTKAWRSLGLLTTKPVLHVANIGEDALPDGNELSALVPEPKVIVCAEIEAELAGLDDAERLEYLHELGLASTGLDQLIQGGHELLGLHSFFTAGPKEARSWTIPLDTGAAAAAGRIHGDFERGFICAETISYADYIECGGEHGAREAGKMRQEGRDYVVCDGDVIRFRFNV